MFTKHYRLQIGPICSLKVLLSRSGTAEELASDEYVRKVYLGQNFELRR